MPRARRISSAAHQLGAELRGSGQQVAHRALRPGLVIHLGIMAGETEGAVRREPRYGSALMTGDAVHMGFAGVRSQLVVLR